MKKILIKMLIPVIIEILTQVLSDLSKREDNGITNDTVKTFIKYKSAIESAFKSAL